MVVDSKTLLAVLLGGRAVFTSKPEPGELDKLLEKCLKLTRALPYIERSDVSKKELEQINAKARVDELYRKLPDLKDLKEEIDKASGVLGEMGKEGNMDMPKYCDICKDLLWKLEGKLGKNVVDIKFAHESDL